MNTGTLYQRSATALLRLYPRVWRERYQEEMIAVLAERPATLRTLLSLLLGLFDAQFHPNLLAEKGWQMENWRSFAFLPMLWLITIVSMELAAFYNSRKAQKQLLA